MYLDGEWGGGGGGGVKGIQFIINQKGLYIYTD